MSPKNLFKMKRLLKAIKIIAASTGNKETTSPFINLLRKRFLKVTNA